MSHESPKRSHKQMSRRAVKRQRDYIARQEWEQLFELPSEHLFDPAEELLLNDILPSREIDPLSNVFRAAREYISLYRQLAIEPISREEQRARATQLTREHLLLDIIDRISNGREVTRGILLANVALRELGEIG